MNKNLEPCPLPKKKGKCWGRKPSALMLTGHRQSRPQDQLYLTVVLKTTNGAFMNCETKGCSGAVKSSRHEEPLTLLLFPSEKGLDSVRGTGCQLQLWQNGSDKEAPEHHLTLFYQALGLMIIKPSTKDNTVKGKGTSGTGRYTPSFLLRENTQFSKPHNIRLSLRHYFSMTLTKETSGTCYSASLITLSEL